MPDPEENKRTNIPGVQVGSQTRRMGTLDDATKKGEIATVIHYYTDTYRAEVQGEAGGPYTAQRLRYAPGDIAPLPSGTKVAISREYGGTPLIMGVIADNAREEDATSKHSVTGLEGFGGDAENRDPNPALGNFRKVSEPTDIKPGDHAVIGALGNVIAALQSGSNIIKAGALSQIQVLKNEDLIRMVSRNFQHFTDMGIFEVKNNEGTVSMTFRGGTNQLTETGIDEENWTIRMDIAENGDAFSFEITTPQGQVLFRLGIDADGRCEIFGINGVSLNSGNQNGGGHQEDHAGNSQANYRGTRTVRVDGAETHRSGSYTHSVSGDHVVASQNDVRLSSLRDSGYSAGRRYSVAVAGDVADPLGVSTAFNVATGQFEINMAGPVNGVDIKTNKGNLDFTSTAGGNFLVTSPLGNADLVVKKMTVTTVVPDSVVLGGGLLRSHVAKFEELQAYIRALHKALDFHGHLISGTAQAGPFTVAGVTGFPIVPISSPLEALVPFIRSNIVGVGG